MTTLGDIVVLGLGASGVAAARYCAELIGLEANSVTAVDANDSEHLRAVAVELASHGVSVELGAQSVDGRFDLAIASPGIPPHAPLMQWAHTACREVVSEIEFAFRRTACPWVAVTGTNGKTTTTALVTHLLVTGGVSARSVGNIGTPAILAARDCRAGEVLVAEVSSFQLALTSTFHPRTAVLLNITPDHIDWHGSVQAYAHDKGKVFANLGADDVAVVDVDDPGSAPFADELSERGVPVVRVSRDARDGRGAHAAGGTLSLDTEHGRIELVSSDELLIKGDHNVSNALAAAAAAHAMGVAAADLRRGLKTFAPIEHRLEPVAEVAGVEWFNDSKATNPDAVFKAIGAFTDRPVVLLVGGRNKGNDFHPLAREAAEHTKAVVAFGEAGPELEAALIAEGARVTRADSMAQAIEIAARQAEKGDAVVLSPACASFDEFSNYEQRGRVFKDIVRAMAGGDADESA